MRRCGTAFRICLALLAWSAGDARAQDRQDEAVTAVVADFDNHDTSREGGDRAAAHAARVHGFADRLRDALVEAGLDDAHRLTCDTPPCSAGAMPAKVLIGAAQRDGARLLVYGGIHKMSTLVQMGRVQVVDLTRDKLVLDQSFSFRGDNAKAFRRAARFVARAVAAAVP